MLQILASSSCLQVSTSERYKEGGNVSLKKSSSWRRESKRKPKRDGKAAIPGGKAKGSPSVTEKLQQAVV
jgi:hypothetical protein